MTDGPRDPLADDWDRLTDRDGGGHAEPLLEPIPPPDDVGDPPGRERPVPPLQAAAAAWGDAVAVMAVCTAALGALAAAGYRVELASLPWAVGVGAVWWCASAAVTLVVRVATPGMLMAGIRFESGLPPGRVPRVLAAALVQAALLGLPAAVASRGGGLLSLAAGSGLRPLESRP